MIQKHGVTIQDISKQKTTTGVVSIETWNSKERIRRALKYGGMTLGAAIILIPVPIVHLVLVPLLIFATPFVTYFFYNQKDAVKEGKGLCPDCGKEMDVAKSPNKFPLEDICNWCRKPVTINLENVPSQPKA